MYGTAKNFVNSFGAAENAVEQTGTHYSYGGSAENPGNWQFKVDKSFTYSGNPFSVELNFSSLSADGAPYPQALHGQGFSILCDGCMQYINIVFDANKTVDQSEYDATQGVSETGVTNNLAREFTIGVKGVQSADDLAETIFEGISVVSDSIEKTAGSWTSTRVNTADDILVNAAHNLRIRIDTTTEPPKIFLTKDAGNPMQFLNGVIPNPNRPPLEELEKRNTGPLWVQHGTQSGQHTNLYIKDMQTKSLGTGILVNGRKLLNESDRARYNALNDNATKQAEWVATLKEAQNLTIDDISVTTVKNANIAIRVLDGALEYALDQATTMGAYLQRLEFTDANVTTMGENVQNSESTIRDADMAKEMTEYTKSNILMQASQAMLAQANQNTAGILELLR